MTEIAEEVTEPNMIATSESMTEAKENGTAAASNGTAAALCDHALESGEYCQCPALRGRRYCYYHLRQRGERMRMARARAQRQHYELRLPALDDMTALRVAFARVADALAAGLLPPERAGRLTYTLQQVACALRWEQRMREKMQAAAAKADAATGLHDSPLAFPEEPRRVEEYRDFEPEFELPAGLDLSQPPHVAFPPPPDCPPGAADDGVPEPDPAAQLEARTGRRHIAPTPRGPWTIDDIEVEDLERQRNLIGEQAYLKRMNEIHQRYRREARSHIRQQQEATWQAEADRRNALEEKKARIYREMDEGQRRTYDLGFIVGFDAATSAAQEEAKKKRPSPASGEAGDATTGQIGVQGGGQKLA